MGKIFVLLCFVAFEAQLSLEVALDDTNISAISTEPLEGRSADSPTLTTEAECYDTEHHSFCNCRTRVILLPQDYKNESGVLYVGAFNASYNVSFYRIHDLGKGQVIVCAPNKSRTEHTKKHQNVLFYITVTGYGVSMPCIFIHIITFLLVRKLRNMPGYNLACLCISMFCGYASFLLGSTQTIYETRTACVATASATQFFLLSSFFWMNIISFDIFRSLWDSAFKLRIVSAAFQCKKFTFRCLFCCGTSSVIVILSLIMDSIDGVPVKYRPLFGRGVCWFQQRMATWIFFISPAFISIAFNIIFLGLSIYIIAGNRVKTDNPNSRREAKKNLILYSKLALITGMLWLSGVLARVTDSLVLWYLFAVLNVLQGFFIFLAFTLAPLMSKNLFNVVLHCFGKPSGNSSTKQSSDRNGPCFEGRI